MKYIASWSGGKDSTAMIDIILRRKMSLDYIIFMDTLMEFDDMYQYIDKISMYWRERYGVEVIKLQGKITYEKYINTVITKGKNAGIKKGFLNSADSFCEIRRDNKIAIFEKFAKNIGEYKTYIGFTTDEKHRLKNNGELYPLIEWGMSENDCRHYLKENEMENPLYRHFSRTGCSLCPYKSKRDFYNLFVYYPKEWQKIKNLESLIEIDSSKYINKHFFSGYKTTEQMEKQFSKSLSFEFDDEPLKDCLCKI